MFKCTLTLEKKEMKKTLILVSFFGSDQIKMLMKEENDNIE